MTARGGLTRRSLGAALAAALVAALGVGAGSTPAQATPENNRFRLTVLGTSDTHGNILNWDYYKDAVFDDHTSTRPTNAVGLAKVASRIEEYRSQRGAGHTLVLDAGDTIQGTPLATYFAKQEPITRTNHLHPMAAAMNLIHYDAATIGNHEFNYGIPFLQKWTSQLDFPALAANAVSVDTGQPAFRPYVIKTMRTGLKNRPLRVGILGLTNPGVAIWDHDNVAGRLRFDGMVETAKKWVPVMKAHGADIVIVSAHGGDSGTSSYGPELPVENAAALVAKEVPGVDAVLFGHAHNDVPQERVTNDQTGEQVLLSEPSKWGQRLTVMTFELKHKARGWTIAKDRSQTDNIVDEPEDPAIKAAVADDHQKTVDYVNQVVATSTEELSAAESRYKDTPILDFIQQVQTDTVEDALAGTQYAGLPVLSIAAPFSRDAVFPAGQVKIKDVAGLYIYDNTLEAVTMTGAEVKAYLEYSAKYFNQTAPGAPVDTLALTNAGGTPDYNYDTMSGVHYDIDIAKPVGQRIENLTYGGAPVQADDEFVVAVNNYRRSGGGAFPGITKTQVYNQQKEIRQLLIDWAQSKGVIDKKDFYDPNWQLTRDGVPVF